MSLSTKPEVHNVLQYHQRRTESRLQVTCPENARKFGEFVRVVCEMRKRTAEQTNANRQTNRHADHNTSNPYRAKYNVRRLNSMDCP